MEGAGRAKGVVKALTGRLSRRVVVVGVAAAVSAASLGGISYALTSSSASATPYQLQAQPSGSSAATQPAATQPGATKAAAGLRAKRLRTLLKRTVHASFIVKDRAGQYVTVDADRGSVTASSATSITVLRPDGVSVTATIGPRTHLPKAGLPALRTEVVLVSHDGSALRIFDLHGRASGSSAQGASS